MGGGTRLPLPPSPTCRVQAQGQLPREMDIVSAMQQGGLEKALRWLGMFTGVAYLIVGVAGAIWPGHWDDAAASDQIIWAVLLVAGGLLVLTGLRLLRSAPARGATLVSLGAVIGALPIFWALLPLLLCGRPDRAQRALRPPSSAVPPRHRVAGSSERSTSSGRRAARGLNLRETRRPAGRKPQPSGVFMSAPGKIRTCDLCLRRAALYPLSYGRAEGKSSCLAVRVSEPEGHAPAEPPP